MLAIELANQKLNETFQNAVIKTTDLTGNPDHLHMGVFVASDEFDGKMLIDQHQMVMNALNDLLKSKIHAVKIKTQTLEQYRQNTGVNNDQSI